MGYGDLAPSTPVSRVFTLFFIIYGIVAPRPALVLRLSCPAAFGTADPIIFPMCDGHMGGISIVYAGYILLSDTLI